MYLLARHFGVDEHKAMRVYEAWYVDLLLDGLRAEAQQTGGAAPGGAAPDTLEEWR